MFLEYLALASRQVDGQWTIMQRHEATGTLQTRCRLAWTGNAKERGHVIYIDATRSRAVMAMWLTRENQLEPRLLLLLLVLVLVLAFVLFVSFVRPLH